jgi:hypothetical protein
LIYGNFGVKSWTFLVKRKIFEKNKKNLTFKNFPKI